MEPQNKQPALRKPLSVLRLEALGKTYNAGTPAANRVLHDITLQLNAGELCALIGPSGSGKSTLLNIIGLLDAPTEGELYLQGQPTRTLDDQQRTHLRNQSLGFVFQFHHLIPAFNVLDNVLMPLMIRHGKPTIDDKQRARELLAAVGLADLAERKASHLSGGQQQRVAIARALVTRPALLLADEPTGNLDTKTAASVFELFRHFNQAFGCAVLVVTHDPRLAAQCPRTIELVDGRVQRDEMNTPK